MCESQTVELYEYEIYSSSKWITDEKNNWKTINNENSKPPDEIILPSNEWCWDTNWRIIKKPGVTDRSGWEYASKFERFADPGRNPKPEKMWNDKARRRKWCRIMRRDTRGNKSSQFIDSMPLIQKGLRSIYTLRVKIEDAVKQTPDALQEPQMIRLLDTVRQNMLETMNLLNHIDITTLSADKIAVVNKLKNDLQKEQDAIEAAINSSQKSSQFQPLTEKRRSNIGSGLSRVPSSSSATQLNSSSNSSLASSYNRNGIAASPGGLIPPSPKRGIPTRGSSSNINSNGVSNGNSLGGMGNGTPKIGRGIGMATQRSNSNMTPNGTPINEGRYIATSSSSTSSGVVSGGRNVPFSLSFNNISPSSDGSEEGMFVQRTEEELIIEQKLIPIDEAEIQAKIIEERSAAIEEIHKGLCEVNEMFTDLSRFIKNQQGDVEKILLNTEESHSRTAEAFSQIVEANRLQQEANCIIS